MTRKWINSATVEINDSTGAMLVDIGPGPAAAVNAKLAVSVNASTLIVAANPARKSLLLVNNHASNTVWLSLGSAAVSGQGIPLLPNGGSWSCSGSEYTGAVYGVASSATTVNGAET